MTEEFKKRWLGVSLNRRFFTISFLLFVLANTLQIYDFAFNYMGFLFNNLCELAGL